VRTEDALDGLRAALVATANAGRSGALAFYGGSFDGLPTAERRAWLDLAGILRGEGLIPGGLRVSAHPAGLSTARVEELRQGGVDLVEVGIQSLDDAVLVAARRGHDAAQALAACRSVMAAGLDCVVQLMVGLPGGDAASDMATAREVAALGPDGVRIHPTLVLRGTQLAELLRAGAWTPPDLDAAVERVAAIVELFDRAGIPVLRLGIQDTEGLQARVVAGARHPAFGELVRGELLARRLAQSLGEVATVVEVPRRDLSKLLGHGRRGLRRLEELAGREIEVRI